ncbi:MAG: proline racemase family protein, partial [Pyramidobacter sp.]|nr:proline racemase family protein [Pyramidobacter sp.]
MEIRRKIPCSIIRGGTSKGVYFLEKDVPAPGKERDAFLLRLMGSPDKKQIDGLGGAASVTSKVALLAPSQREDADVDYTFAQVSVDKPLVSYKGNCGNISSGVGAFAVEEGMVEAREPWTTVRVYNTNTQKVIVEEVRVVNGQVAYTGDCRIPGVPGTASPVRMKFMAPAGSVSGRLLPTGSAVDRLDVPGLGAVEVSIVDAANPLVFVKAASVGLTGR